MRALVKAKREPGLWMQDLPVPEIGHNDALIRVRKAAICGTDIHIFNWDPWSQKTIPVPQASKPALSRISKSAGFLGFSGTADSEVGDTAGLETGTTWFRRGLFSASGFIGMVGQLLSCFTTLIAN